MQISVQNINLHMKSSLSSGKFSSILSLKTPFFPLAIFQLLWFGFLYFVLFFPHVIFTFVSYFTFPGKVLILVLHITDFIFPMCQMMLFFCNNMNFSFTVLFSVLIISYQIHLLLHLILLSFFLNLFFSLLLVFLISQRLCLLDFNWKFQFLNFFPQISQLVTFSDKESLFFQVLSFLSLILCYFSMGFKFFLSLSLNKLRTTKSLYLTIKDCLLLASFSLLNANI